MWTRAELKDRAKMCLSRYYWAAFLVSLIFAILSGFGGSNANTQRITSYLEQNESGNGQTDQSSLIPGELGGDGSLSGNTGSDLASGIELVPGLGDAYGPGAGNAGSMVASNLFYRLFAGAVVVIVIISVVIGIFVQPLFEIGRNRFYMESPCPHGSHHPDHPEAWNHPQALRHQLPAQRRYCCALSNYKFRPSAPVRGYLRQKSR